MSLRRAMECIVYLCGGVQIQHENLTFVVAGVRESLCKRSQGTELAGCIYTIGK